MADNHKEMQNNLLEELKKHNNEHGPRDLTPGDVTPTQVLAALLGAVGIITAGFVAANPEILKNLFAN